MPVLGGHHFLQVAKVRPSIRHIPVLVLTTSENARHIQEAYYQYASGYFVKSSTFDDLQVLVKVLGTYGHSTVALPRRAEPSTSPVVERSQQIPSQSVSMTPLVDAPGGEPRQSCSAPPPPEALPQCCTR